MPDASQTLEILISLGLVGQDKAAEAREAIKSINSQAEEGSEKFKIFGEHTGEARKAVRELSREFPVAGEALKAFITPVGATVTAAIFAFRALKKEVDDLNASLDAMESNAAGKLNNFSEASVAALTAATQLSDKFTAISTEAANIASNTNKAIAALRQLETAQLELAHSEEAKKLAQVNADEASGRTSGPAAIAARQQIREDEVKREAKIREDARTVELTKLEGEKTKLEGLRKDVGYQPISAADAAAQKARVDAAPKDAAALRDAEKADDLVKAIAAAKETLTKATEYYGQYKDQADADVKGTGSVSMDSQGGLIRTKAALDKALTDYDGLISQQQRLEEAAKKIEDQAAKLDVEAKDRETAKTKDAELGKQIEALNEQIKQLNETERQLGPIRTQTAANTQAAGRTSAAADIEKTPFGKGLLNIAGIADQYNAGAKNLDPAMLALIQQIGDTIAGHKETLKQAAQAVGKLNDADGAKALLDAVTALAKENAERKREHDYVMRLIANSGR